ncbi:integrin alpha-PS2 [Euwallacea similis]|uniref:integrin alpha-PS2 n=1 Tax=Euwallacea similis TaxID=1736056 RepID=UPI00344EE4F5
MDSKTSRIPFLRVVLLLFVAFSNFLAADGFNVDAVNYAVYESQEHSMFGFTVAVHKQGYNRGWVLVGAPEAQSQYQPSSVRLGGVVYKCRTDSDDTCQEIPFDRDGNQYFGLKEMDQKSGQWFGATLSTSGSNEGGPVVACAPRYVWYSKEMNRRDPVGTCFVADSLFEKFEEYSPCRTSNWGYHRQGSCQAGFSAAINSVGDRLFVGAPGSYYWQGQMYSIDAHARFNYTPGLLGTTYGAKGSVHQQSLEIRPAVFQTREGKQQDDDSYLGYSTIVGDFLGTGEQGIAVGMPRGAELHGKVLLFTWNLTNYKNISGSQLGSYFGYALASGDIDGDGKLDLIVGAPMHTEPNTEGKYDVGRVYVFYQGGAYISFNKSSFIDGINSKSRFGHSVACLGDMNQDGYDDFAVGAPYDGEFQKGTVYIYYGSSKGVLENYGQVIHAEEINTKSGIPLSTFGFSVTGGMDMDGNDYPDLAVGAYLSSSAFFFRSRPVVRVESFVRFRTESKQIDIKKKNCNLPNGQRGTCTSIDFCIKYTGKGIPQQIRLNVQYILDTKKPNIPRMAFLRTKAHTINETITLYKDGQDTCQTEEIYIRSDIRDKLTPLEAEVKYFMIQEDSSSYGRARNPQSQLKPVLDLNLPPSRKDSISIQKNCGHDNVCIPDLHLNITKNVEKYLLDSHTNLEFDIIVSNLGEDSFETTLDLVYPEGIYYKKAEVKEDMQGILCSHLENRTISCDIGNPLPARKIAKFRMIFVPYDKQGSPTYEFDVTVNSTNPELNETILDNYSHVSIEIWVDSALDVSGRSIPQEIYLSNTTQYSSETIDRESDIGPQVTHLYTLKNKGPATIYEAEMYLLWPWQTLAGEDLLYLLEQPHVPEGVKCEIPAPANYKNYQLDYNLKPIWERLQIDASSHGVGTSSYSSVKVESGKSVQAVAGGTRLNSNSQATKLDEEIKSSSGDASEIFEKRHNDTLVSSGQDTSGVIKAGETVNTKSEWRTVTIDGRPVTKWTNVTTVRDSTGKIVKTFYSTDDGGTQMATGNNFDSFGQSSGGYRHRSKPKVVYTSSGGVGKAQNEENLGVSGQFGSTNVATHEDSYERKTSGHQLGSGNINEQKSHEEHAYTVGGGPREGGFSTTPSYIENQTTRRGPSTTQIEQANEARLRYEERRQHEERLRLHEEQKRRFEEKQRHSSNTVGQNVVLTQDEEHLKYEQRHKQEEEERRRYQAQLQREEELRAEEKARQLAYEEQIRKQEEIRLREERRRQEIETQRRRPAGEDNSRRQQQQREEENRRRVEEEENRRQEDIRYRQEAERRRQYELAERRRIDEERRRQWDQQQSGSTSWQQQASHIQGGRYGEQNGYAQGVYHGEPESSGGRGGVLFNHTWTAEGTATIDEPNQGGGQLNFGEAAASGNSFRTQTIDLGMVGRGGANDLSRQQSSGQDQWTRSGQRTRGGSFSGTLGEGISHHDEYSSEWERSRWEELASRHIERDNVLTEEPDLSHHHRGKRQPAEIDPEIDEILKCTATRCFYVKCTVGELKKDDFISIALRSRLNVRAIRQLSTTQPVKLSSMMVARISQLPYIGKPKDAALHSHEIFTDIPAGEQELTPQAVPLWIILLSAIAGTLILLLVILLLYKCGFFKRKRPSSAPERQPLRTNGYHPSD